MNVTTTDVRILDEVRPTLAARSGMTPETLRRHLLAHVIGLSLSRACEWISRMVDAGHLEHRDGRYHAPRIKDTRPGFSLPGQGRAIDEQQVLRASGQVARRRRILTDPTARGRRPVPGHLSSSTLQS